MDFVRFDRRSRLILGEKKIREHDVHLLGVGDVAKIEGFVCRRLQFQGSRFKKAVDEIAFVGDVGNAAEWDVMSRFREDSPAGDDSAIGHRVRIGDPFQPRPADENHEADEQKDENRPSSRGAPAVGHIDKGDNSEDNHDDSRRDIRDQALHVLVHVKDDPLVLAKELL